MYFRLGQFVKKGFIQGLAGFHIFSLSVFSYIAGTKASDIILRENEVLKLEAYEQISYM